MTNNRKPIETDEDGVKATIPPALLAAVYGLYHDLAPRFTAPLTIDYSSSDGGEKCALLHFDTPNRWGPLVLVLWGERVPGVAVILGADGSELCAVETVGDLPSAMEVAKDEALAVAGVTA